MENLNEIFSDIKRRKVQNEIFPFGKFSFLFQTKDPIIINILFPEIEDLLTSEKFIIVFVKKFHDCAKRSRDRLLEDARASEESGHDSRFYMMQIPAEDRKLEVNSLDSYTSYLDEISSEPDGIVSLIVDSYNCLNSVSDGEQYVRDNFALYMTGSFLYDYYLQERALFDRFDIDYSTNLEALYKANDINLRESDNQFYKYKLLSKNEHITINNFHDSQTLSDKRIKGKYLWINVPRDLLSNLVCAINYGFIKDISFNINGISDVLPSLEAKEIGSVFAFDAVNLPAISKFYDSEDFENCLWIKVGEDRSITIEELCANFLILNGRVVTQAVHLEFTVNNGNYFITHLDHEYFIYSKDDYERRKSNPDVRGYAKWKSFKIDKAHIPLNCTFNNRYFLFNVLNSYFKNKDLIREYFENVQNS